MRLLRLTAVILAALSVAPALAQHQACWHQFGRLQHPRSFHNALPIGNGKVLVMGGLVYDDGATPHGTTSCEIIDVFHWSIHPAAPMHEPRAEFIALTAPGGNIVAVSGLAGIQQYGALSSSVEMYDVATGQWRVLGSLMTPRRQHAAAFISDHEILVVGGLRQNHDVLADAEIFDISTGHSRAASAFPFPINCASMQHAANGDLLALGGRAGGANSYREKTVYRYDIANDRWEAAGEIYQPIQATNMLKLWDGRLLISGGSRKETPYDFVSDVQLEGPAQWGRLGTMQSERAWSGSAQWTGDLVLTGGGYDDHIAMLASTDWVDLISGTITPGPRMLQGRSFFPMVSVPIAYNPCTETPIVAMLAIAGRTGWDVGPYDVATRNVEILIGLPSQTGLGSTIANAITPATDEIAVDARDRSVTGHSDVEVRSIAPNPSRGATSITFNVGTSGAIRLAIYSASGTEVARLFDGDAPSGQSTIQWDGAGFPSGTYYVRLQSPSGIVARTLEIAH